MPIRIVSPIGPVGRTAAPSHSLPPAHKFDPVIPFVDVHRLRQASRAAREVEQTSCAAPPLHESDAFQRFDRAHQNSRAGACFLARDVHHEAGTVCEIHVGVSVRKEERTPAGRKASKRVPCRIADRIGFGFDNAAGEAHAWQFVHQRLADQISGQVESCRRAIPSGASGESARERPLVPCASRISPPASRCPAKRRILRSA